MINTKITVLLHLDYPIIQGGMAWVADHHIAAAVSQAGGLGIIAGGSAPPEIIQKEIRLLREKTDKPFGVNIMLLSPYAADLAKLVAEEKVPVVTTGAGNPEKYMEMWKSAGIKVMPVIPSVSLATRMERIGADAVVAEGCEAGGHIGESTTMTLVPQVASAVSIPVIAAGGIGDGRGLAAAFMLGAQAVQCGTVFLAAEECNIHQNYKDEVISAKDTGTIVTGRIAGHAARQLKNPFSRNMAKLEKTTEDVEVLERLLTGSLYRAVKEGDIKEGSFMAGQIAGLVDGIYSAKEILEKMNAEAEDLLLHIEERRGISIG